MQELVEQPIVMDAVTSFVYVGTLERFDEEFFVLRDADVHDLRDTPTLTREQYVLRCREHGHSANRLRVWVRRADVASMSRLQDVVIE